MPGPKPGSPYAASKPAWGAAIGIGLNSNLLHEDFPSELAGARRRSRSSEEARASIDQSWRATSSAGSTTGTA